MRKAGDLYDYVDTVDGVKLPPVDAIAVLAGGRGRIGVASDVWYRYWELGQFPLRGTDRAPVPEKAPILYLAGMGERATFATVQAQVRRGVKEVLKTENVILENRSRNTVENAQVIAAEASVRGWERVLLITSPYHMRRAKLLLEAEFRERGIQPQIETYTVWSEVFDAQDWRESTQGVRVTLEEYFKWRYQKWKLGL